MTDASPDRRGQTFLLDRVARGAGGGEVGKRCKVRTSPPFLVEPGARL
jgi:hypothetical protein